MRERERAGSIDEGESKTEEKMHENVVSAKFASKDKMNQHAFQEL